MFQFLLGATIYQIVLLIQKYYQYPISINLNVTFVEDIIFPAVTICNSNIVRYRLSRLFIYLINIWKPCPVSHLKIEFCPYTKFKPYSTKLTQIREMRNDIYLFTFRLSALGLAGNAFTDVLSIAHGGNSSDHIVRFLPVSISFKIKLQKVIHFSIFECLSCGVNL